MNLLGGRMAAPAAEVDRDLEQVLLGLADGSYVLSTPDGAVAESGVGVVGLLGVPADVLVGRPITEVLVAGVEPQAVDDFDRMLRAPHVDPSSRPTFRARCANGTTRTLQFVVVCVPLALGWEFTSLLSELRSRDAGTWKPEELRLRHDRALEAVEGVVLRGTQPDPQARLAGILIVVRDADAPPLTREDVDRRMADQRGAARAVAAEQARRRDEAAGRLLHRDDEDEEEAADQAPGLEDLVERARVLRERVEDAERDAAAALHERDEALARLAEVQAERDAAQAQAGSALDAEGRVQQLAGERDEARARLETRGHELLAAHADAERLRAELLAMREAVHDERAAHSESADAELAALRAEAGAAHGDADALRAELHGARSELNAARGENALAHGEASAVRAQLQSRHAELESARAALDAVRAQLEARNADLEAKDAELERTQAQLETTRAAADDVRAEREQARLRAQQLMNEAEQARAAAAAIRAEFAFEPIDNDGAQTQGTPAAQRAPWTVPAPTASAAAAATCAAPRNGTPGPELPAVGPGEAAALIALDGSFKRLDESFCSLLGCREEDLRAARWPSIIDRENLSAHQEVARALKAGEIQSAEVETVYMHAQGLLVPIAGTISVHRAAPSGEPHFLFRADVSRTAGAR